MSLPSDYRALLRIRPARGEVFTVHAIANGRPFARLGMIVSKRTAKRAVDRNYVKRLIRESFRARQPCLTGRDVLVRVHRPVGPTASDACIELGQLLDSVAK